MIILNMASYSIYEAKANLSALLRQVKKGHEAVITERGQPVARVIPFARQENFEEKIKRLETQGVITPAKIKEPLPENIGASRPGALQRFLDERE